MDVGLYYFARMVRPDYERGWVLENFDKDPGLAAKIHAPADGAGKLVRPLERSVGHGILQ